MEKLVSVIIINYNKYHDTINCIKSLEKQNYHNFEILLLDNGSKYEQFLKLKNHLKNFENKLRIRLIRSNINLYFTAGTNKAIKISNGEFICLLNNDVIVSPDFIDKMVYFLETHPDAGMITPKIKVFKNKNVIWNAGASLNFKKTIVVINRGYLENDPYNQKYNKIETIGFAPGTAVFLKKNVINEIGLIDDIFLLYHEDPDWNLRAQMKGYKSYYVPTTIVYHNVPITKRVSLLSFFFFKRNSQILAWRYAKFREMLIFYYLFCFMNFFEILYYVFKKRKMIVIIQIRSIIRGFRIGVRKKSHRSCKKHLLKDYYYARYIQNLNI